MTSVGVAGGLSVDHLITRGLGVRFDCLGGPALFGALGARLVKGTAVRVHCLLPDADPRFRVLFTELGVDCAQSRRTGDVHRLWILNAHGHRRIVRVETPAGGEIADYPTTVENREEWPALSEQSTAGLDGLLVSSPPDRVFVPRVVLGIDPSQRHLARDGVQYLDRFTDAAVLLPSRVQLSLLHADPRSAARTLCRRLGAPVVARLDREGCYVATEDGDWSVIDRGVHVFETTGAGDASAAAVVAAMAAGATPVEAALLGTSVARLALAGWGHEALAVAEPITAPLAGVTSHKGTLR